jgi:multicomponent Na+:H+ antiporter subunit C
MFALNFVAAVLLFLIGLYGVVTARNLIRILLNLGIMESATYLMLVAVGYREGATAPIFYEATVVPGETPVVDPIMQALALTSIVIGVVTLALALAMIIHLARRFGTLDARQLRHLRG